MREIGNCIICRVDWSDELGLFSSSSGALSTLNTFTEKHVAHQSDARGVCTLC